MGNQKAGWYPGEWWPNDVRWWDGEAWADAYWQVRRPDGDYAPSLPRWDISTGVPWFDIVGENWREKNIGIAIGQWPAVDDEAEEYLECELVPEPDNPFDSDAVSVRYAGLILGYLPSHDDAPRAMVRAIVRGGAVPVVQTRIWAVTRQGRDGRLMLKSAIRLALPNPIEVFPRNAWPSEPHAILPLGRKYQVTGEEAHFDVLKDLVGVKGAFVATLHPIDSRGKAALEVRFDGHPVGRLTPATSAKILPAVQAASRSDLETAVFARVEGSHLAAEVIVHAAPADQLPRTWPKRNPAILPVMHGALPPAHIDDSPLVPPPGGTSLLDIFSSRKRPPSGAKPGPTPN